MRLRRCGGIPVRSFTEVNSLRRHPCGLASAPFLPKSQSRDASASLAAGSGNVISTNVIPSEVEGATKSGMEKSAKMQTQIVVPDRKSRHGKKFFIKHFSDVDRYSKEGLRLTSR